jgi:hypothetical protein
VKLSPEPSGLVYMVFAAATGIGKAYGFSVISSWRGGVVCVPSDWVSFSGDVCVSVRRGELFKSPQEDHRRAAAGNRRVAQGGLRRLKRRFIESGSLEVFHIRP